MAEDGELELLKKRVDVAAGRRRADLVLKNAKIVNVVTCEIIDGDIAIADGVIAGIGSYNGEETHELAHQFVCPGFIDGHVHIESSMLSVPQFARLTAPFGTSAVVADPHEIANVLGAEGIRYMLASSKFCPIYVYFMASSCVPASPFESAGAQLSAIDIAPLLTDRWVLGLAEMMNYPGVVAGDADCLSKILMARGRPIDGHAPGLSGHELCAYACTGIGSDHECTTADEANEKLRLGLHIMIREGSQARNLEALVGLVRPETLDRFMFVTDDKDVEDLVHEGHMDHIIRRSIRLGLNPLHAIRLATLNPAAYFGLQHLGAVAPGKDASICVVDDLQECSVRRVYHHGKLVAQDGECLVEGVEPQPTQTLRSSINTHWLEEAQFAIRTSSDGHVKVHVIQVSEGRIDAERSIERMVCVDHRIEPDPARDLCKIAVVERHQASGRIGLGFVRGFGLHRGAIASSVSHDSHNLVVAGTNDHDMYVAAVQLIRIRGGFCVVDNGEVTASVALPIGGLMSPVDARTLERQLEELHAASRRIGATLRRSFMALSFLTLSVIGRLKITDLGLVDVERSKLIDLIAGAA